MPVNPEKEHGERAGIDDAKTVGFAGGEGEGGVGVETGKVGAVLGEVDEGGLWDWFGTTWVGQGDEGGEQCSMCVMIPVSQYDSKFW